MEALINVLSYVVYAVMFFIPHFLDEDVALVEDENDPGYLVTAFPAALAEPDDDIRGVVLVRSLVWLGVAWFPKQIGDVRPWTAAC